MQELRLAIRRLTSHKGASLASMATLACSIGATVMAWSLVSSVLLRPLPVANADRLFVLGSGTDRDARAMRSPIRVYPQVRDARIFEQVARCGRLQND